MTIPLITQVKHNFHTWCGVLSLKEILSNKELMNVIERLERMLIAMGA